MAKRTVEFALSDETSDNMQTALTNLKKLTDKGFAVSDVRIEERDQDGTTIKIGVIEASI